MSKVIEITDVDFEEAVLRSDVPAEVDFWAPWCGPCKMVSPIYDKLSEEYDGRFKFCKIDVDQNQQTAARYQIMSIPMQMYFADGEKVDEILGAVPESVIRSKVQEVMERFPTDVRGRLGVLLTSWVQHNKQDSEKFRKWLEKARSSEDFVTYGNVIQAAEEMEKASQKLSEALRDI